MNVPKVNILDALVGSQLITRKVFRESVKDIDASLFNLNYRAMDLGPNGYVIQQMRDLASHQFICFEGATMAQYFMRQCTIYDVTMQEHAIFRAEPIGIPPQLIMGRFGEALQRVNKSRMGVMIAKHILQLTRTIDFHHVPDPIDARIDGILEGWERAPLEIKDVPPQHQHIGLAYRFTDLICDQLPLRTT